jgi:hypothetical protein
MFGYVDQLENEMFVCRTPRPRDKNVDDDEEKRKPEGGSSNRALGTNRSNESSNLSIRRF